MTRRCSRPSRSPPEDVSPAAALTLAALGLVLQVAASLPLGVLPTALGLLASASAVAYNLWLSRRAGVVPALPRELRAPSRSGSPRAWGLRWSGSRQRRSWWGRSRSPPTWRTRSATSMRTLGIGSGNLAQRLGRRTAFSLAWGLAMAIGIGVGTAFIIGGGLRRGRPAPRGGRDRRRRAGPHRSGTPLGGHAGRRRLLDRCLGARHRLIARPRAG